jgi:hypothetical protein
MYTGITGGFAPPAPSAIHDLSWKPGTPHIFLVSRFPSNAEAEELALNPRGIPISDDTTELVNELEHILRELPTEEVPSSDIYGRNIGIFWQGADGFVWANSAPEGCGGFQSEISVTDDNRRAFDRAVEITEILVKRGVAHEST